MKYVWLTLNWAATIGALAVAAAVALMFPLAVIPLVFAALLFLPPLHRTLEAKFQRRLSAKVKAWAAFACFAVCGSALLMNRFAEDARESIEAERRRIAAARSQVETNRLQKAEDLRKKREEFQATRESIVQEAQRALSENRFEDAVALAARYEDMGDTELARISMEARKGVEVKAAAAARAKEETEAARLALRYKARAKEIVAELPKVPAQDFKRNFFLYQELTRLVPEDNNAAQKLAFFRKKYEDQQERERIAAEKSMREEQEKAAIQAKVSRQFSGWDGSHRNLEELIKRTMNDPDSYKHVETSYRIAGKYLLVSTTFRGKNAFGALVVNSVSAMVDFDGNVIKVLKAGP